MNGGGEHVHDRRAVAAATVASVRNAPPEERGGAEETQMLNDVHGLVLERLVVERRQVPDPEREAVQREMPTSGAVMPRQTIGSGER